nr:zinc finger, CCHC-type [Tanacetum cinerariifolium]
MLSSSRINAMRSSFSFLFIIAMDGLHIAMEDAKAAYLFHGLKLDNVDLHLSHLLYADVVIFMGECFKHMEINLCLAGVIELSMLDFQIVGRHSNKWYQDLGRGFLEVYDRYRRVWLFGFSLKKKPRELQKMIEAKGDDGERFYVRGRSNQRGMKQGRGSPRSKSRGRGSKLRYVVMELMGMTVLMVMSVEQLLDWIMDSGGTYHMTYMRDYLSDFEEYDGSNVLLGGGRECCVQGTGKVRVQIKDGSSFVLDNVRYVSKLKRNMISLGTLEKESFIVKLWSGMIKVRKARTESNRGIVGYQLWRLDEVTSKVVLYRNMGFNESGEYKKTFIGSGVGECPSGRLFTKVETKNFIGYHSACDREPHSTRELFTYREDINEVALVVAEAEKIYAHESLTFNDSIACEVNSKWKTGLKEEMDARSDVYVLSNGCKKCGDNKNNYFWEHASVGSQEYHGVCTRLGIASADVGMFDGFDRGSMIQGCAVGWEAKLQHVWALSTTEAEYVTLTETCLAKCGPRFEVPAVVGVAEYWVVNGVGKQLASDVLPIFTWSWVVRGYHPDMKKKNMQQNYFIVKSTVSDENIRGGPLVRPEVKVDYPAARNVVTRPATTSVSQYGANLNLVKRDVGKDRVAIKAVIAWK